MAKLILERRKENIREIKVWYLQSQNYTKKNGRDK